MTELQEAIALAGSNGDELGIALAYFSDDPFALKAARFLIVNLPLTDLGKTTADELIEHVELSVQVRKEMPYGLHYDDAIWAHYVLPPRVTQEPLQPWRPCFYQQLKDLVTECQTLQEATVIVNQWCSERVHYQPTQRRDQGPLTTLAGGYGRCEELMIVLVDALRSVGIPARNAYCPWWTWGDSNHAWTESYGSDQRWHFAERAGDELAQETWFDKAVSRGPLVVSMCFGVPIEASADVFSFEDRVGARYCRLNSTATYRQTGTLCLHLELENQPDTRKKLHAFAHVYNYGALRKLVSVEFDAEGNAVIALGAGDYIFTTDARVENPRILASIIPGVDTVLNWETAEVPPQKFVLHYPSD